MKTKISLAVLLMLAAVYTLQAQTNDSPTQAANQTDDAPSLEQELVDTLAQAFDEALHVYKLNVKSEPDAAIRLNEKLYEAQFGAAEREALAAEQYLGRAKQVEEMANDKLNSGRGTSTAMLEAKASRLKAMLELERSQQ